MLEVERGGQLELRKKKCEGWSIELEDVLESLSTREKQRRKTNSNGDRLPVVRCPRASRKIEIWSAKEMKRKKEREERLV